MSEEEFQLLVCPECVEELEISFDDQDKGVVFCPACASEITSIERQIEVQTGPAGPATFDWINSELVRRRPGLMTDQDWENLLNGLAANNLDDNLGMRFMQAYQEKRALAKAFLTRANRMKCSREGLLGTLCYLGLPLPTIPDELRLLRQQAFSENDGQVWERYPMICPECLEGFTVERWEYDLGHLECPACRAIMLSLACRMGIQPGTRGRKTLIRIMSELMKMRPSLPTDETTNSILAVLAAEGLDVGLAGRIMAVYRFVTDEVDAFLRQASTKGTEGDAVKATVLFLGLSIKTLLGLISRLRQEGVLPGAITGILFE